MKNIDRIQEGIRKSETILVILIDKLKEEYGTIPDEYMIIILMFRKIIEKADAVFILCDNGAYKSAESITRDVFENYLFLNYIIDGNYKEKAFRYIYQTLQDELQMMKKLDRKNNKINDEIKEFYPDIDNRKNYIDKRLKQKEFHNIKIEWDRMLKSENNKKTKENTRKKKLFPTWYNLNNGPKSIKDLSRKYGMFLWFDFLYNYLSKQVHSVNIMQQIQKKDSEIVLSPLRVLNSNNMDQNINLNLSIGMITDSLIKLTIFYNENSRIDCNDCIKIYGKWYKEKMKL